MGTMHGRQKDRCLLEQKMESQSLDLEDWDLHAKEVPTELEDWSLHAGKLREDLKDWPLQSDDMEFDYGMVNWSFYGELRGDGNYILDYMMEKVFGIDFMQQLEMVSMVVNYMVHYIKENVMVQMALAIGSCIFAPLVAHRACKKSRKQKRREHLHHLGHGYGSIRKFRRWDPNVPTKWKFKMRLRGILLLGLMSAGPAMDQQQTTFADQVLNQVASLARASTEASQATTGALRALQAQQERIETKPRTGDITKILKQPEIFF